jgi:hypothetical protein
MIIYQDTSRQRQQVHPIRIGRRVELVNVYLPLVKESVETVHGGDLHGGTSPELL